LPDAVTIGNVKKGTKITLQYVSGQWKSWGHVASARPDDTNIEGGDACRLVIALPGKEGKNGSLLAMVPANTRSHPFVFEATADYPQVVLRINDRDDSYADNPGSVDYAIKIEPPK
jgi:hypothetical protein